MTFVADTIVRRLESYESLTTGEIKMTLTTIRGISIPDSQLARTVTEVLGDTESPSLLHHCSRVYYFSALAGKHRRLKFESALPNVGGEGISRSDATLLR
jgi:hypothetical protein